MQTMKLVPRAASRRCTIAGSVTATVAVALAGLVPAASASAKPPAPVKVNPALVTALNEVRVDSTTEMTWGFPGPSDCSWDCGFTQLSTYWKEIAVLRAQIWEQLFDIQESAEYDLGGYAGPSVAAAAANKQPVGGQVAPQFALQSKYFGPAVVAACTAKSPAVACLGENEQFMAKDAKLLYATEWPRYYKLDEQYQVESWSIGVAQCEKVDPTQKCPSPTPANDSSYPSVSYIKKMTNSMSSLNAVAHAELKLVP